MGRTLLSACAALRRRYLTAYATWVLLTLAAAILGLGSLAYGVSDRLFAARLPDEAQWPTLLAIDGVSMALALLVGPWLFVPGLRWRWPEVHGWLGRLYAVSAMASASVMVVVAWQVEAGPAATTGLLVLGSAWLIATVLYMIQAWREDIGAHRRWMVRSFVLAAAIVSLRFCFVLSLPFAATCLAGISMIVAAEMWLCRTEDTASGSRRERQIPPALYAFSKLGIEIATETLDAWHPGQVTLLHTWPGRTSLHG
jgi:hypothetical protein